jgi:SAM-dependent methyltransferase
VQPIGRYPISSALMTAGASLRTPDKPPILLDILPPSMKFRPRTVDYGKNKKMPELGFIYADGSYLASNKNWHQEDSPYKAKLVCKAISRNKLKFTSCADIGCGAGLVTELLAKEFPSSTFQGFDLSKDAKEFWKTRLSLDNLSFKNENLLDCQQRFDLVVCLDVFEHVENYFGFLRDLSTKGKYFVFNIPLDMNVMKMLTPGIKFAREEVGHLHYFNRYTALQTIADTGYRIHDWYLSSAFTSTMPRNIRQAAILPIRLLSLALGKRFASTVFGGISLVVTASPS